MMCWWYQTRLEWGGGGSYEKRSHATPLAPRLELAICTHGEENHGAI